MEGIMGKTSNSSTHSFFVEGVVKSRTQMRFKQRCDDAIKHTGLSQSEFYRKAQLSRQMWYNYSWRILPFPAHLKIKLCDLFGKPFRDLFLMQEPSIDEVFSAEPAGKSDLSK